MSKPRWQILPIPDWEIADRSDLLLPRFELHRSPMRLTLTIFPPEQIPAPDDHRRPFLRPARFAGVWGMPLWEWNNVPSGVRIQEATRRQANRVRCVACALDPTSRAEILATAEVQDPPTAVQRFRYSMALALNALRRDDRTLFPTLPTEVRVQRRPSLDRRYWVSKVGTITILPEWVPFDVIQADLMSYANIGIPIGEFSLSPRLDWDAKGYALNLLWARRKDDTKTYVDWRKGSEWAARLSEKRTIAGGTLARWQKGSVQWRFVSPTLALRARMPAGVSVSLLEADAMVLQAIRDLQR